MVSCTKGKSGCSVGHTAKGYIAGVRQGDFPKEVTIKSKSELLDRPGQGTVPWPGGTSGGRGHQGTSTESGEARGRLGAAGESQTDSWALLGVCTFPHLSREALKGNGLMDSGFPGDRSDWMEGSCAQVESERAG